MALRFFLSLSRSSAVCAALWPVLQGCAQAPAVQPVPAEMRLLVQAGPGAEGLSADALARRAGQLAQVPVRHISVQGAGWHALALACGEPAACEAATQRLRGQPAEFQAVEADGRASRGPAQPKPEHSR